MAYQTKASRMAIVEESSEGVPVAPSSGADFLAVQDGFSLTLEQDVLESAELKGSIGASQSLVGFEVPKGSAPHYLRHSGVEGQSPQSGYSKLLKAAFGSESVNATQYVTIAGSTTSVVKVGVGIGANFSVGEALLIKHASFDWEIAVIKSISGDDLTVLFQLQNAPVISTGLGKSIFYNAINTSGHPTLSVWDYRANGAAVQLASGMRVLSMAVTANAGDLLNAQYDLEGVGNYFNPVEIGASDIYLDFLDDATTRAAVISAKMYKSPMHVAAALQSAMNALGSSNTFTVSYTNSGASAGKYVISSNGTTLSLLWSSGANSGNTVGDKIGFSVGSDDVGSLSYTSDSAQVLSSPYTPAFDSPGTPLVVKNSRVMIGSQSDYLCFSTRTLTYTLTNEKANEDSICAESGRSGSVITGRGVTIELVANIPAADVGKFYAMNQNQGVSFQFNFGSKSGNSWEAGKSGVIHIKDMSYTAVNLGDADGLVTMEISGSGFVDSSGNPETALNLL